MTRKGNDLVFELNYQYSIYVDFPLAEIRIHYSSDKLLITKHMKNRLQERNISINDVEQVILTGTVIQIYEEDKPFPSCLLSGKSLLDKPLHVVISYDGAVMYAITAYNPDIDLWEEDYMKRKEKQ